MSEAPHRSCIFLCHSSGDKQAVRELYKRLRADGFDPWLDEEDLQPGQDWEREIAKAVRACAIVLVCLSRDSINKKGFVQKEIKHALDVADEHPDDTIFLIPLKLEECKIPERLRRWHSVNLFEAKGYQRLTKTLRQHVKAAPAASTSAAVIVHQAPLTKVTSGIEHGAGFWAIRQRSLLRRLFSNNARRNKNRNGLIVGLALALAYLVVAGLVPAFYIQNYYTDGSTFVNLYSHLFRYNLFFGWITILLLIYPVLYLISLPGLSRITDKILILIILTVISSIILALDTQAPNSPPYEVRPEILRDDDQLKNHFTKGSRTEDEKKAYQNKMTSLLQNPANWSTARYLHYLTIFMQVFNLLSMSTIVVALTINGKSLNVSDPSSFKQALVYCSLANLVSYLGVLMRVAFYYEKPLYFPEILNPVTEVTMIVLSIMRALLVAITLISWRADKFSIILSLANVSVGFLVALAAMKYKNAVVALFGKDVESIQFCMISLMIVSLCIFFVVLSYKLKSSQNAEAP